MKTISKTRTSKSTRSLSLLSTTATIKVTTTTTTTKTTKITTTTKKIILNKKQQQSKSNKCKKNNNNIDNNNKNNKGQEIKTIIKMEEMIIEKTLRKELKQFKKGDTNSSSNTDIRKQGFTKDKNIKK